MRRIVLFALLCGATVRAADTFTQRQREFWSFQPVLSAAPPVVKHTAWVGNPIDRFIAAKLEARQIEPARSAEKVTLLRRASFDLIGLPPTPQEVEAFLADQSPQAFEK
jgi:uncharacterized protein DUF1549